MASLCGEAMSRSVSLDSRVLPHLTICGDTGGVKCGRHSCDILL
jgi:hypothetical protein